MAKKKYKDLTQDPDKPINVSSLGKGVTEVARKKITLNTKAARKFLEDYEQFLGERSVDSDHVDKLVKEMRRGRFFGTFALLTIVEFKGKEYRVNGQHTCHARLHFEGDTEHDYEVYVARFTAETYEDVRNIYTVIDRGKGRTKKHVLHAQLAGYKGWTDIHQKPTESTAAGFPFFRWEDTKERKSWDVDEQAHLLKTDYLDLGVEVARFVQNHYGAEHKHLRLDAVTAALYATIEAAGEDAIPFWETVADGINIVSKRVPPAKLRTFLQQHRIDCAMKKKDKATPEHVYRMCIHLWNHWRSDPEKHVMQLPRSFKGFRKSAAK